MFVEVEIGLCSCAVVVDLSLGPFVYCVTDTGLLGTDAGVDEQQFPETTMIKLT